eukprot:TRINITY_DN15857_c0_g1_i1.p1 TRINITY_DN15857_c0_g1~~TRINITY_DN15857_c0_g1_i1.p1  ORF type:complete len:327 (-),score=76.54 TRINITY_DN15857_c0_g1_i1:343-1287(-)
MDYETVSDGSKTVPPQTLELEPTSPSTSTITASYSGVRNDCVKEDCSFDSVQSKTTPNQHQDPSRPNSQRFKNGYHQQQIVMLEVSLYDGCICLDYAGGVRKTRKLYDFFLLRFLHLKDEGIDNQFCLICPEKILRLEAKNPQSKNTWKKFILQASRGHWPEVKSTGPEQSSGIPQGEKDPMQGSSSLSLSPQSALTPGNQQKEEMERNQENKVSTSPRPIALFDQLSQMTYNLKQDGPTTIGRSRSNFICVKDDKVSRFHAKIEVEKGIPFIQELGSTRGIKVNNKVVTQSPLTIGDIIDIAGVSKFICVDKS